MFVFVTLSNYRLCLSLLKKFETELFITLFTEARRKFLFVISEALRFESTLTSVKLSQDSELLKTLCNIRLEF